MKKGNSSSVLGLLIVLAVAVLALVIIANTLKKQPELPTVDPSKETSEKTDDNSSEESNIIDESIETPNVSKDEESNASTPSDAETSKDVSEIIPDDESEPEPPLPESYEYLTDISEYLEYIEPEDRDEYLFLVNYNNLLDSSYKPTDLVDVVNTRNGWPTQKLRLSAAKALEALFIEAKEAGMTYINDDSGYRLSVTSGYRSYNTQKSNFEKRVDRAKDENPGVSQEEAEEIAAKAVARPGTSEHQTGLCVDMHNMPEAIKTFKNEEAAKWLVENSHKFGFILRYPEDKTEITKIMFEPWHFRFVGRYHATRIHELGMCLEEYMEYLES